MDFFQKNIHFFQWREQYCRHAEQKRINFSHYTAGSSSNKNEIKQHSGKQKCCHEQPQFPFPRSVPYKKKPRRHHRGKQTVQQQRAHKTRIPAQHRKEIIHQPRGSAGSQRYRRLPELLKYIHPHHPKIRAKKPPFAAGPSS